MKCASAPIFKSVGDRMLYGGKGLSRGKRGLFKGVGVVNKQISLTLPFDAQANTLDGRGRGR